MLRDLHDSTRSKRSAAIRRRAAVSPVKLGPKRYSVTADPTKGAVALSGCSNDGYSIDPTVMLPAKPTPAASVCLIETVKGAGGAGKIRQPRP